MDTIRYPLNMFLGAATEPTLPSWDAFSCFLTLISILLTAVGVILVVGGWVAFWHFGRKAEDQAKKTAALVARNIAVQIANEYCEQNIREIVRVQIELLKGDEADALAKMEGGV